MKSYLQLLTSRAEETEVSLLKAFKQAGVPTSTYYRTINLKTELRYFTAIKVMTAIEKLYALKEARDYTRELRESGGRIDTRKIRARFKPRVISS
jgi:predicted transcriptional regulator